MFDRCYVEEVMEPEATRGNESDNLCDYVDNLLNKIYNWDTHDIDHLTDLLEEYYHFLEMYDTLAELYPHISWSEIPNHHFKYDVTIIKNVDNELVFGIDSSGNYYLRQDHSDNNFELFSLIKNGEAK